MSNFAELDETVTLAQQMESDDGPIVLVNLFTVDPSEAPALVAAWAHDADFMKAQPVTSRRSFTGGSQAARRF